METINNLTTAATKAIWGTDEANEEPVSGVKGNTNQGEPYDAGNIEDPLSKEKKANVADAHTTTTTTSSAPTTGAISTSQPTTTTGLNTTTTPSTTTASTETAGLSGSSESAAKEDTLTHRPSTNNTSTGPTSTEDSLKHKEDIGKPELKHESPANAPHADSAAGKTDIRNPADPATDAVPKHQDVDNTGPTLDADKLDGPGPKPLEAVAKERGGDAGKVDGSSHGGGLIKGDSSSGSIGLEKKDSAQSTSHGEGTGEQYVKTSGLAADGGDFDATKPGAGREADRLLDERDPAHAAAKAAAQSSNKGSEERTHSPNEGTEKEKRSLGDKIKAKLHRH